MPKNLTNFNEFAFDAFGQILFGHPCGQHAQSNSISRVCFAIMTDDNQGVHARIANRPQDESYTAYNRVCALPSMPSSATSKAEAPCA